MMRASSCTTVVVMILFVCHGSPASGQILTTTNLSASSTAELTHLGTRYHEMQQNSGITYASSQALAGLTTTPEARTAGRVSDVAIAVNARLDDKLLFGFSRNIINDSNVLYRATLTKFGGPAERVIAHFHLPFSEVETRSFVEQQNASLHTSISARIESHIGNEPATTQFSFSGEIFGSFQSEFHPFSAFGQPGLDVTSLLNPTFTDTTSGGFRTTRLEFASFTGMLDLGILEAGQELTFEYALSARVVPFVSLLAGNVGIASINDPFFFDSDPVTPGVPVVFEFVPASVPEPATLLLAGVGGLALLGRWVLQRRASGFRSREN